MVMGSYYFSYFYHLFIYLFILFLFIFTPFNLFLLYFTFNFILFYLFPFYILHFTYFYIYILLIFIYFYYYFILSYLMWAKINVIICIQFCPPHFPQCSTLSTDHIYFMCEVRQSECVQSFCVYHHFLLAPLAAVSQWQ